MAPRLCLPLFLGVTLLLSGCAAERHYDAELNTASEHWQAGKIDTALALMEVYNPWTEKDLLYYLETGELQRAKGDLIASQLAWRRADRKVFVREESVKLDTGRYIGVFGSYLYNDKVRRYDGYDYEKVMLTTQMALNRIVLDDFDGARIEIKKTHEREALIANLRDKEYLQLEEQAREQGIDLRHQDLHGYPVATLNAPEVLALKNSYQNAFSHYLAGFVYETLGEKGLAAAGYRQAIELRPKTPLLEQALLDLDKPAAKADQGEVLIVVQNGLAPARGSVRLPVTIRVNEEPITTLVSFPILVPDTSTPPVTQLSVDGRPQKLIALDSISAMSRRALHDDMPGILMRTQLRAKVDAQIRADLLKKKDFKALAEQVASRDRLEDADTRTWRTLPDTTLVVRVRLKKGRHLLSLPGKPAIGIQVDRAYQAISLRLVADQVFTSGLAIRSEQTPDKTTRSTPQKPPISRSKVMAK